MDISLFYGRQEHDQHVRQIPSDSEVDSDSEDEGMDCLFLFCFCLFFLLVFFAVHLLALESYIFVSFYRHSRYHNG